MEDTRTMLRRYCENARDELTAACDNQRNGEEDGDIYDYIADALDVEYRLNSRLELIGVKLYVALGGPNIWVDTYTRGIEGAWGADAWSTPLDSDICEELDQYFEEELRCRGLA